MSSAGRSSFVRYSLAFAVLLVLAGPTWAATRTLTFEDRVRAQEAIERVYYSHQIGATKPFEEAVPREVIERKVRAYLEESSALAELYDAPVTDEAVHREWDRIALGTRFPERLKEIYDALGNDPPLIQECFIRPVLVGRLAGRTPIAEKDSGVGTSGWPSSGVVGGVQLEGVATPPEPRDGHTAIWTGSLMIIWGGSGVSGALNTGGRYDPLTDSWTATSTLNAPEGRWGHTAVWTGDLMLIWGGTALGASHFLATGGRYNPLDDTWSPISTTNAPPPAEGHTAIWTGDLMIIWGGGFYVNTGGRYHPDSDTWTPTTTMNAPIGRFWHTAVWTGEKMIIWGGTNGTAPYLNSGGRYDPVTDEWTPTSTADAPAGRAGHSAVWTGDVVVIWGGSATGQDQDTGGRYDPLKDVWTSTSTYSAPSPRRYHAAAWTRTSMVVWGGVHDLRVSVHRDRQDRSIVITGIGPS